LAQDFGLVSGLFEIKERGVLVVNNAAAYEPLPETQLADIQTILILCWGLLGDVFVRVPVIEAVRKRFPEAKIVVVLDPASAPVLQNHPACDELVLFSRKKKPWLNYLVNTLGHLIALRKQRFDLCIYLYCGGSSAFYSRIINARYRLSFDHTPELLRANNLLAHYPSFGANWSKALGSMLRPLGIADQAIRKGTTFYCSDEAIRYAKSLLQTGNRYIAFNLGAGADEKRWPVSRFVELAQVISEKYGYTPLVFTNPGMEYLAQEFAEQYQGDHALLVLPLIPFEQVGAVMRQCDYVVTGDTSIMHMAFGLKRPTLVMFTHSRPEIVAPEDSPYKSCFRADPNNIDPYGLPYGTVDIPVAEAMRQFDLLVATCSSVQKAQ
jgi:ADP-heptose:LPS heptosyltransferase